MAFTSILRKSATSLVPMASRLARVQRKYHSAIFTALNHAGATPKPSATVSPFSRVFSFSTAADSKGPSSDESILHVIESEIKYAVENDGQNQVEETPDDFPFKIEDTPGLQTVTLTREYQGEDIKVQVQMPSLVTGDEIDNEDNEDEDAETASQSSIPLLVTISKKGAPSLEFSCTAFPDEIAIESLAVTQPESEEQLAYEGPDFHDLDENLQKAFHKYLEIRGIKPSTTNFLHEYMINKDSREYVRWLNNLKQFIEA